MKAATDPFKSKWRRKFLHTYVANKGF
jgi:hypothetical protein